jgi:hypothetical protein
LSSPFHEKKNKAVFLNRVEIGMQTTTIVHAYSLYSFHSIVALAWQQPMQPRR